MVPDFAKYSSNTTKRRKRRRSSVQRRHSPHSQLIVGQQTVLRKRRFFSSLIIMGSVIAVLISLTLVKSLLQPSHPATSHHTHQSSSTHTKVSKTSSEAISHSSHNNSYQFYSTLSHLKLKTDQVESLESFTDYANRFNYELQVASTRQHQTAERIREKLGVLGLDGHINRITGSEDGQTWWRVKLGPYFKIKNVEAVEKVLEQNNMNYIRLTHRKKQNPSTQTQSATSSKEAAKARVLHRRKT